MKARLCCLLVCIAVVSAANLRSGDASPELVEAFHNSANQLKRLQQMQKVVASALLQTGFDTAKNDQEDANKWEELQREHDAWKAEAGKQIDDIQKVIVKNDQALKDLHADDEKTRGRYEGAQKTTSEVARSIQSADSRATGIRSMQEQLGSRAEGVEKNEENLSQRTDAIQQTIIEELDNFKNSEFNEIGKAQDHELTAMKKVRNWTIGQLEEVRKDNESVKEALNGPLREIEKDMSAFRDEVNAWKNEVLEKQENIKAKFAEEMTQMQEKLSQNMNQKEAEIKSKIDAKVTEEIQGAQSDIQEMAEKEHGHEQEEIASLDQDLAKLSTTIKTAANTVKETMTKVQRVNTEWARDKRDLTHKWTNAQRSENEELGSIKRDLKNTVTSLKSYQNNMSQGADMSNEQLKRDMEKGERGLKNKLNAEVQRITAELASKVQGLETNLEHLKTADVENIDEILKKAQEQQDQVSQAFNNDVQKIKDQKENIRNKLTELSTEVPSMEQREESAQQQQSEQVDNAIRTATTTAEQEARDLGTAAATESCQNAVKNGLSQMVCQQHKHKMAELTENPSADSDDPIAADAAKPDALTEAVNALNGSS